MKLLGLLPTLFLPLSLATCPPGTIYENNFNKCYQYVDQPATFLAAEITCQNLGGHLVAVQNGFENSFISGLVLGADKNINSYWIGANYLLSTNWNWTYNVPFSYSNWAPGQPSDPSIYQCGEVRTNNYYWYKQSCNAARTFVCSMDPNAPTINPPSFTCPPCPTCGPLVSTTPSVCPPEPTSNLTCSGLSCRANYTMSPVDCKCYFFGYLMDGMTYYDSLAYCQSQGGSLVKITTKAQNNWLTNWIVSLHLNTQYPWIGLSCFGSTKDTCRWADGSPLACYDNFDDKWPGYGLRDWNGTDPHFFIRLDPNDIDFGQWCRYRDEDIPFLCMQDPQRLPRDERKRRTPVNPRKPK